MSHLEDLLFKYYEWKGYIVRRNVAIREVFVVSRTIQ